MQTVTDTAPYRIHHYPTQLIARFKLHNGQRATLRPVLPQDQKAEQDLVAALSTATRRNRFHGAVAALSAQRAAEMTCIDYRREMAFVVTVIDGVGDAAHEILIADGRYTTSADGESAEFALVVADAWQSLGVGRRLISALCTSAHRAGVRWLCGEVLAGNRDMVALMQRCGFCICPHPSDDDLLRVEGQVADYAFGQALDAENDSLFGSLAQALPRWWRQHRGGDRGMRV